MNPLTSLCLCSLFCFGCGSVHVERPVTIVQSVAEKGEIRAWALKAYWAEQKGELAEAQRCFEWVLRLDGDNPEARRAVDEFLARQRSENQ